MPYLLLKVRPTKRGQNTTNIPAGGWIHASNLFVKRRSFSLVVCVAKRLNNLVY